MYRIRLKAFGACYFIEPLTGSLLRTSRIRSEDVSISTKVRKCLEQVDDPYLLAGRKSCTMPLSIPFYIRVYAQVLNRLCRHSFLLARLWGKIPLRCYPDAGVATAVYYALYPGSQQRKLCLPRAFFARSASRRFRKHGTMFIGAFLPSVQMHAWVIEDGMHADPNDDNWINFAPVAAFD